MPKFGFVIAACLALVAIDRVRRLGVWLQLDGVRGQHPDEAIDGVRSVLRVLVLFALVTPFWSLFDQKASTWVLQANAMSEAELVSILADAGAQSGARHAADSVQQPRPLSGAATLRI